MLPDDILALAVPVLSHRVSSHHYSASREDIESVIRQIIAQVEVPV